MWVCGAFLIAGADLLPPKLCCKEEGLAAAIMAIEPWAALFWQSLTNMSSGKLNFPLHRSTGATIGRACLSCWRACNSSCKCLGRRAIRCSSRDQLERITLKVNRHIRTSLHHRYSSVPSGQPSHTITVSCLWLCTHERDCLRLLLI